MDKEKIEEAKIYLTHTAIDDFNLLKHQAENRMWAIETLLQYIDELEKEKEELKKDLQYVLEQTLGAFEHNWCIDWNFSEIREKYGIKENIESEE